MDIIVAYQHRDMLRESETEIASLTDALRFADGCIEDGGHAEVTVWVNPGETLVYSKHPWTLCDVHIEHNGGVDAVAPGKYELVDEVPTCRYCGADLGNCNC